MSGGTNRRSREGDRKTRASVRAVGVRARCRERYAAEGFSLWGCSEMDAPSGENRQDAQVRWVGSGSARRRKNARFDRGDARAVSRPLGQDASVVADARVLDLGTMCGEGASQQVEVRAELVDGHTEFRRGGMKPFRLLSNVVHQKPLSATGWRRWSLPAVRGHRGRQPPTCGLPLKPSAIACRCVK